MNGGGWLAYVQLLDSALPIGGFAHSFGLETAVQEGRLRSSAELRLHLAAMLHCSWAPGDAMGVKAVYEYAPKEQWGSLWNVDRRLHLAKPGAEAREGSRKLGSRLLHLARSLYPELCWEPLSVAVPEGLCVGVHSVVHGFAAWRLGVSLPQAAEGYLYTCLAGAVNSALRLMAIGQTEGQRIVASLLPEISMAWERCGQRPAEDFYNGAPGADMDMMRHDGLYSRLFMS